ncbi:MAG: L-lactate permease [Vicinamibacterales bacterium]
MPDVFRQVYDPVAGSILLSALAAAAPLAVLAVLLAVFRVAPWKAAVAGAATAFGLAWFVWGAPFEVAVATLTHGMAFGLWPISWVVICAVFFYNLSVASGDFDVIRRSLSRLTSDRRIQVLLVAFCFGALIEGIAGFGAPVAITASMLAGLGFEPIAAAVLALVANTAPVAFGSIGIPVTTLGGLVAPILGRDPQSTTLALSAMVGRQLPFFSLLVPAYLIVLLSGWRGMIGVVPAVATAGVSFAVGQFLVSNLMGPELTDILSSLISLGATAILLRVWQPRDRPGDADASANPFASRAPLPAEARGQRPAVEPLAQATPEDSGNRVVRAYATYAILVAVVLGGQVGNFAGLKELPPPVNVTALLRCGQAGNRLCPDPWVGRRAAEAPQAFRFPVWDFNWPGAYRLEDGRPVALVRREPPTAAEASPYPLTFRLDFLASAGTLVLLAAAVAFIPMMARGLAPAAFLVIFGRTLRQLRLPIVTISFILSIATVMNYSGMTSSMALALAGTGVLFPFFSAFLGMLGVFLTGSDTSSNTLFGPLQAMTARVSGIDPVLMAATNSSGGVMGKMISPQNLSVGAAGVGAVGSEGAIFRRVVGHSLILTALMGVLAMLQAYVVPWMVPAL